MIGAKEVWSVCDAVGGLERGCYGMEGRLLVGKGVWTENVVVRRWKEGFN